MRVSTSRSERSPWLLSLLAAVLIGASGGALSFATMTGESIAIRPDEGPVVLHFWATWCPTCVEEMGTLDAITRQCQGNGVRMVAVNVGESTEEVTEFTARHQLELEMLRDPRGKIWRKLSGQGLPLNVIWTREERRVFVGPRSTEWWREALSPLGCLRVDPQSNAAGLRLSDRGILEEKEPEE